MEMSEWAVRTLGSYSDKKEISIQTGPFGTQLKASDYVEEGIPVINVRNIGHGIISDGSLEYITTKTRDRLSSHILHENDIVLGRKGAVERHAFIDKAHDGWFQGSDCIRIRINSSELRPRYISYYLLTPAHVAWMVNNCSHGAIMASLNQDIIKRIAVPVPELQVQDRIISILSSYDDLIENNNRRIAILEEMAQKLYREWFVHFRFPGHKNVKMVESELGLIPDGWNVERLSDTANIIMGQSPKSSFYNDSGEGLPFHQGVTNFTALIPEHKAYSTGGTRIAEDGDILFSVRAPVGRINIADCKLILGRGVAAIRHKQNHQAFLLFLLKTTFDRPDMIGNGAIFNSVTKSDMSEIKVIVPVSEITLKFDNVANSFVKELITIYHKNTNLRKTRDLLLPRLISGDIDISKLEISVKEE